MKKVTDRLTLGLLSGAVGFVLLTLIDVLSATKGISQRALRTTAAGVWVSSRKEAEKWSGQILGVVMSAGLSMLGGVATITLLTKYGRDKLIPKGLFFGLLLEG